MSDLTPLFAEHTTGQGRRLSGGLARQTKRAVDVMAAETELAATREQAHAFLASVALTNAATLVVQAEAHMRVAPAGREMYENILSGYGIGAVRRLGQGL